MIHLIVYRTDQLPEFFIYNYQAFNSWTTSDKSNKNTHDNKRRRGGGGSFYIPQCTILSSAVSPREMTMSNVSIKVDSHLKGRYLDLRALLYRFSFCHSTSPLVLYNSPNHYCHSIPPLSYSTNHFSHSILPHSL